MAVSTVWFDGQFWVLTLEICDDDGDLHATQLPLGPEPSQPELYELMNSRGNELLIRALRSPAVTTSSCSSKAASPKRASRKAANSERRPSTAAQEALRLEREQSGQARRRERRVRSYKEREEIRQKRRKRAHQKHRGH